MRNFKLLLISMCLSWLTIGANAQEDTNNVKDYGHKSYGIFVHYGSMTRYPDGSKQKSVDEAADNFDVQGFVNDIAAMSPEYLIFTAWHLWMNPLYPSAKMTEWLGEDHSSKRDVLQELLDACDAKGIDVYFYIQPSEAHNFSPEEQAAVGYIDRNTQTTTYNNFINEMIAEITERYKSQFKGFWFDKGLSYRCTDTKRIGETIRAIMPDAVLIAPRDRAQDVKLAVAKLKKSGAIQAETFPRDHRPWGWFESIAIGSRFQVKRIVVHPGAALSLQSHHHRADHWIVVEGTARVTIDDKVQLVTENQSVYIPLGAVHRMENPGKVPMVLIEVQTGSYLGEDDIIRYEDIYSRGQGAKG